MLYLLEYALYIKPVLLTFINKNLIKLVVDIFMGLMNSIKAGYNF